MSLRYFSGMTEKSRGTAFHAVENYSFEPCALLSCSQSNAWGTYCEKFKTRQQNVRQASDVLGMHCTNGMMSRPQRPESATVINGSIEFSFCLLSSMNCIAQNQHENVLYQSGHSNCLKHVTPAQHAQHWSSTCSLQVKDSNRWNRSQDSPAPFPKCAPGKRPVSRSLEQFNRDVWPNYVQFCWPLTNVTGYKTNTKNNPQKLHCKMDSAKIPSPSSLHVPPTSDLGSNANSVWHPQQNTMQIKSISDQNRLLDQNRCRLEINWFDSRSSLYQFCLQLQGQNDLLNPDVNFQAP